MTSLRVHKTSLVLKQVMLRANQLTNSGKNERIYCMVLQNAAHALLPRSAGLLKTGVGFTPLKAAVLPLAPSLIRQTTLACHD
jgi:hypothetical protein